MKLKMPSLKNKSGEKDLKHSLTIERCTSETEKLLSKLKNSQRLIVDLSKSYNVHKPNNSTTVLGRQIHATTQFLAGEAKTSNSEDKIIEREFRKTLVECDHFTKRELQYNPSTECIKGLQDIYNDCEALKTKIRNKSVTITSLYDNLYRPKKNKIGEFEPIQLEYFHEQKSKIEALGQELTEEVLKVDVGYLNYRIMKEISSINVRIHAFTSNQHDLYERSLIEDSKHSMVSSQGQEQQDDKEQPINIENLNVEEPEA